MADEKIDESLRHMNIEAAITAITFYERIRYGNDQGLGFDAVVDEVLKQMGLEE